MRRALLGRFDQPVFQHSGVQKSPDELKHAFIGYPRGYSGHQNIVVHPIEELLQIDIHHIPEARSDILLGLSYRLMRRTSRTKSVTVF